MTRLEGLNIASRLVDDDASDHDIECLSGLSLVEIIGLRAERAVGVYDGEAAQDGVMRPGRGSSLADRATAHP